MVAMRVCRRKASLEDSVLSLPSSVQRGHQRQLEALETQWSEAGELPSSHLQCSYGSSCGSSTCGLAADSESDAESTEARLFASSGLAWEYPLSTAEKQERLLLIYDQEDALVKLQLRLGERLAARMRRKVSKLHSGASSLRQQREDLLTKTVVLERENDALRQRVDELELKFQRLQQEQHQQQLEQKRKLEQPSTPQQQDQHHHQQHQHQLHHQLPQPAGHWSMRALWLPPPQPHSAESCGETTCTSQLPQIADRQISNASSRGAVASLSWMQADFVPWIAFTSRASAMRWCYGFEPPVADAQACGLLLRRGEYISTIVVLRGEPGCLARGIHIVTSEGQEAHAGHGELEACDFIGSDLLVFDAMAEHEILGLQVDEAGVIVGVKQAALASSRRHSTTVLASSSSGTDQSHLFKGDALSSCAHRSRTFSRIKEAFDIFGGF